MPTPSKDKMIKQDFSPEVLAQKSDYSSLKKARLGVLGGSGIYEMNSLKNIKELNIETPYGKPSDTIVLGTIGDIEIIFLARHGRNHTLAPTEIPYKANIWAMRSLGVRWILSLSAVGSLQEQIKPLDIVIPNQFIDRTHQRPLSFFTDGVVAHVTMADPFCHILSRLLTEETEKLLPRERQVHQGGIYLAMEGPAFSTRAESQLYRDWGCSIIGMTNHTEARLSREAEIAYASLSMVTDYDCWREDSEEVTVGMVINNLKINAKIGAKVVNQIAQRLGTLRPESPSHFALRDGLVTPQEYIPQSTKDKINIFTQPYWD